MNTRAAEFLYSVTSTDGCPRWNRTEVALAGRSNVGKSSMLNALTRRTKLARISKTPGRTRALNFFGLGEKLALVDLPGYGYAKMARSEAAALGQLMTDYLTRRRQLVALVLLIDARRGPGEEELELLETISNRRVAANNSPLAIIAVATKCDKLRRAERKSALDAFRARGLEPLMCSAVTGEGIEKLRAHISAAAGSTLK